MKFLFFFVIALALVFSVAAFADDPAVTWVPEKEGAVSVVSSLQPEVSRKCINAGLELEHRFLFKMCEKVNKFGLTCGDTRRVIHNFSFDPIQEAFRVVKDQHGDEQGPVLTSYKDFEEGLSAASTVRELLLSFIGGKELFERFEAHNRSSSGSWNLGIRVRTTCKGEVPEFLADLSYFLSFGIIDLYGKDTGWEYFDLSSHDSIQLTQ